MRIENRTRCPGARREEESMDRYLQVLTATGSPEEAALVADDLLARRLAACVQVIGPIASRYWWKGKLESADEWLCLIKTRSDRFEEVEEAIRALHSYDVPEVTAIPVETGSIDYLAWLGSEVPMRRP
jgi:periplasmic divalent cation tolerance protein